MVASSELPARKPSRIDGRAIVRTLAGDRPLVLLCFVSPTLLAIAIDFVLRPRSLLAFEPLQWLNYFGSSLASAGFWGGPLWLASRLFTRTGRPARAGLAAFFALFVFPLSVFCFGGQPLYFHVFHAYMARDTVRLGIALRGTLGAWLAAWGASGALMVVAGLVATVALREARPRSRRSRSCARGPSSRWSASPSRPRASGSTSSSRARCRRRRPTRASSTARCTRCATAVTHKGWVRRGISLREPAAAAAADAARRTGRTCCSSSPRACAPTRSARRLRRSARRGSSTRSRPTGSPLGRLTTQSPGTLSSCVMLWTGLGPDADFRTMHRGARALGGRARASATARRTSPRRTCATRTSPRSSSAPAST